MWKSRSRDHPPAIAGADCIGNEGNIGRLCSRYFLFSHQAFNGAGDTKTPTKINPVFFWLLQIPLAYFLALELGREQSGVFWAVFFSETLAGLFTFWLFMKGRWKKFSI